MSPSPNSTSSPKRQLTVFDCTCIIVGIIIGVGIYETTPLIAVNVSGPWTLFAVWLFGGLIAMVGALCYAELATTYPREGGDYVFISKAYGSPVGFLFAWIEFWIIRPGGVGSMAFVFARYANQLCELPYGRLGQTIYACSAILVMTLLNLFGVRSGKWTQNLLTSIKVVGLLMIVVAALLLIAPAEPPATRSQSSAASPKTDWAMAMIFVLFTFGGWNDVSYVAAEVKDPQKNILRSLILGTATVILIYLAVNVAFLRGLGFDGIVNSEAKAVAADLLQRGFGNTGGKAISCLICISALGAINGMIFTGARVYYALGKDHPFFSWIGNWSERFGVPVRALVLQSVVIMGLVIAFNSYESGFSNLVLFYSPFFWFFLSLSGISLFVLRFRDAKAERSFRVPLFPLTPALFCAAAVFMYYESAQYTLTKGYKEGYWALFILLAGIAVCLLSLLRRPNSNDRPDFGGRNASHSAEL